MSGTRLVRVSEELFHHLCATVTSSVQVEWGDPVEWVLPNPWPSAPYPHPDAEPVYEPTITRHFRDDLDDDEVGDGDSWM